MPWCIHEHDVGIAMVEHGLRREDRDTALTLDRVSVQMRIAIVHAAALANATRVEQHGLGQRGLAGIDMRQDSNDRLLRHGSPLIASPSHAATGILVPHWMIQFTGRRAKRPYLPTELIALRCRAAIFVGSRLAKAGTSPFCLPGFIWGGNNASPTTTRFTKNCPTRGHFLFELGDDTCLGSYASRSQSNATRAVPSDT